MVCCIWHNRRVSGLARLLAAVVLALGVSACARPQARTQPELPPLDVPPVPARTIAPPPPADTLPPAAQEPDPSARKPARPRPPQTKTDPPPQPPPVQPPIPPPVAGLLQTTSPASQAEVVKTIRDLLARAERDLKNVGYAGLSADGRAQYDTARRFASQAEQALKDKNFVFALTLADKAATLARSLLRRV